MKKKNLELRAQSLERGERKPKMTAEQKACLAACKSRAADLERAKDISVLAECVLRDLCKSCKYEKECKKLKALPRINCRMSAIASVAIGMFLEAKGGAK